MEYKRIKPRINYINLTSSESTTKSLKRIREIKKRVSNQGFYRKLAVQANNRFMKPLIRELQYIPPERSYPEDYPIRWTSDKQRRYVMWLLKGKPYLPTNKFVNSWYGKIRFDKTKNRFAIEVKNDTEYYEFIVGYYGMGKSRRQIKRYLKPMQGFHVDRGWRPVYKPYQKYVDKMIPYIRTQLISYYRKI